MKLIKITEEIRIGNNEPLVLLAGPCVIESEEMAMHIAKEIKKICEKLNIKYIFKASFDKANRSSIDSYRGPGIKKGLKILKKIKEELDIPVVTDIHLPHQAALVSEVVSLIQIPAFLCRQTDILIAAGETGKPIHVKKGQFMAPWDMKHVVEKIKSTGNDNIILCERGNFYGYNNLVVDMTSIIEMRNLGVPVIFDATHSVQKPGGKGFKSDGNRNHVEYLARAAAGIGIDGLFLEVHTNPELALSDGPNMVYLDQLEKMLSHIIGIDKLVKGYQNEEN